ncbi:MAG: ribose transport system permease protein [Chloroflexota bacterium]|jgi:ribose transport system permease protein|nr:ribose transport system permease protein [Chloroflexota bacterium]
MTAAAPPIAGRQPSAWRKLLRDQPLIPLSFLLVALVLMVWAVSPTARDAGWVGVIVRAAVPLAILAGCQTLTMLTGGIDLSVGFVASMAGFVTATFVNQPGGWPLGVAVALTAAVLVGLVNGISVGVFRVHPLIVTLGMGLVVLGFSNVWQLRMLQTGAGIPTELKTLGTGLWADIVPYSLIVFVPVALIIILGLRRSGYGRMLYALGDNPVAARLSGVRSWQVLLTLYVISAVLAAIAGLIYAGLNQTASVKLVAGELLPSVAAAVIGGTSILGGRGTFTGTIMGALILTVLSALLTILLLPEPVRQIVFGSIVVLVAAAYTRATTES